MTQPADAMITPALADEVCIRKNADTVVAGSIAAIGAQYLVTLTATDCSGDHVLAAEKAEVAGREAVLPAIDRLIAHVRSKVGESRRSIDRFNVPMMDVRTGSLDALKSYSQATWLSSHGRLSDALPLFQHATDLDPNFAPAYFGAGVLEITVHNKDLGAAALQKAFDLRDTVNERLKLQITATYSQYVTRDLTAALQNYGAWVVLYPKDASAWSDLADAELSLGDDAQAATAGDRALALKPTFEAGYVVPARAYLALNQFEKARAVALETLKIGLGGDSTHDALTRADFALGDDAGVEREVAWSATTPSPRTTFGAGDVELCRGRVKAAELFLDRYSAMMGGREIEDAGRSDRARNLADMGLRPAALALLRPEPKSFQPDAVYTLAEIGDRSRAEALLAAELTAHPSDTLLTKVYAPQTRAALALRDGKPIEAVADLQPALPYRARNFRTDYLLGLAWLAAGDGVHASAAFQTILDHHGWDAEAVDYPLAKLGLARAQHLTRNDAASLASYRSFLADWRAADANVPALIAAKAEYRRLSAGHPG
jgi:predicted Zn-dependent protease